jgi:RHH-type proline utilization regulon transcriptional repressor/proline dehydrogenase/delta 1-pyrroline-5-carboxylate dehydrogenase
MSNESVKSARHAINQAYLADESEIISEILAGLHAYEARSVSDCAKTLVNAVRDKTDQKSAIDAFLH